MGTPPDREHSSVAPEGDDVSAPSSEMLLAV